MPIPHATVLFPKVLIQTSVQRIAQAVLAWHRSDTGANMVLISVLEGAKPFTANLVSEMTKDGPPMGLDLLEVRVKGTESTHLMDNREWIGENLIMESVLGKRVLLVDDLADTGKTLGMLKAGILGMGASEVKTAVLVRKFGKQSGPVDFCGFDLNLDRAELERKGLRDYWLYGYGMDLDGGRRDLDYIGWVEIKNE